mmetsp:Transcript_98180/g.283252  ORF Transcript_98180/g.283252 Transcript_98180/m.283252 type:complete len:237 (+) Transcript_98180:105-815(+)
MDEPRMPKKNHTRIAGILPRGACRRLQHRRELHLHITIHTALPLCCRRRLGNSNLLHPTRSSRAMISHASSWPPAADPGVSPAVGAATGKAHHTRTETRIGLHQRRTTWGALPPAWGRDRGTGRMASPPFGTSKRRRCTRQGPYPTHRRRPPSRLPRHPTTAPLRPYCVCVRQPRGTLSFHPQAGSARRWSCGARRGKDPPHGRLSRGQQTDVEAARGLPNPCSRGRPHPCLPTLR